MNVTFGSLNELAHAAAHKIKAEITPLFPDGPVRAYAVPRGGIPAALAIGKHMNLILVQRPEDAQIIVDDLIDTGKTSLKSEFAARPFFALLDKRKWDLGNEWVVWPWEETAASGIEDHITRIIQYVGDDAKRAGLQETPARVAKAWKFWCSGYEQKPEDVLKTFEDGAEGTDEMVVVKDIPFYSHCEHHLAAFFGSATVAYIPNGKIVGLSKLNRVVDIFARRLQVQERMTCQIADSIMKHLTPLGVGVVIKARHLCMESRGICQQGHHTVTSALRGVFKDEPEARNEFLRLAGR